MDDKIEVPSSPPMLPRSWLIAMEERLYENGKESALDFAINHPCFIVDECPNCHNDVVLYIQVFNGSLWGSQCSCGAFFEGNSVWYHDKNSFVDLIFQMFGLTHRNERPLSRDLTWRITTLGRQAAALCPGKFAEIEAQVQPTTRNPSKHIRQETLE